MTKYELSEARVEQIKETKSVRLSLRQILEVEKRGVSVSEALQCGLEMLLGQKLVAAPVVAMPVSVVPPRGTPIPAPVTTAETYVRSKWPADYEEWIKWKHTEWADLILFQLVPDEDAEDFADAYEGYLAQTDQMDKYSKHVKAFLARCRGKGE